jgi:UDP-N-acetylmuramoyl-tripeptide--D-alanyl-D-alanine ligase
MVGIRAAEIADEIITIGKRARIIAKAATEAGFSPDHVTELDDAQEAVDLLKKTLTHDDVVLIKGSRGVRMDVIVPSLEKIR